MHKTQDNHTKKKQHENNNTQPNTLAKNQTHTIYKLVHKCLTNTSTNPDPRISIVYPTTITIDA